MKENKNILIISPGKVRLTETFIRAHIDNLKGSIHYLYTNGTDYFDANDVPISEIIRFKTPQPTRLTSLLPYFLYFRLMRSFRISYSHEIYFEKYMSKNKIDLVFAEYGTSGSIVTEVCEKLQIPLMVHFHGFDAYKFDTLKQYKNGYIKMFNYAKTVVVVSNDMKKQVIKLGCPRHKVALNPYGPNEEYLNIKVDYSSHHVVAIGRHAYKKAPYLTILAFKKALEKCPKLKFIMIGDGELMEISERIIRSLDMEKQVFLAGALDKKAIIPLLNKSFLFVQHSLVASSGDSEGTPVAILEAMASGLPIVSTRHAGIKDAVVEEETGILVDEGDIDGMSEAIVKIYKNRELAKQMGLAGRNRILKEYTLEKHLNNLNKLIDDI